MYHEIFDQQISLMANRLLRSLLTAISENELAWYVLIAEEATDIAKREQLNVSIRCVNNNYEISGDPVGMYCQPNTVAETVKLYMKLSRMLLSDVAFLSHCVEDKHIMGHPICKEYKLVLPPQKLQLHCLSIARPIR